MKPKVTVIILNFNGLKDTVFCLEKLLDQNYPNFEVIVIDNGSYENEAKKIKEKFPQIKVIRLEKNLGFAGGINWGLKEAFKDKEVKFIATLNNDAFPDKNWLSSLVDTAQKKEKIGMVASKIYYLRPSSTLESVGTIIFKEGSAAHKGTKEKDKGQYNQEEETFAPCAGAALYKREMLEDIGFFDEKFFAYFEDVDLGWRAQLKNWKCIYTPKALVIHKHSATSLPYSSFKFYHKEKNRYFVLIKNYPLKYIFLSPFLTIKKWLIYFRLRKIKGTSAYYYQEKIPLLKMFFLILKAEIKVILSLPYLIKERIKIQKTKKVSKKEIKGWFEKFGGCFKDLASKSL